MNGQTFQQVNGCIPAITSSIECSTRQGIHTFNAASLDQSKQMFLNTKVLNMNFGAAEIL
jgi:hypothetical protein